MPFELSEWICGLSLRIGCLFAAAVYLVYGVVFLTVEILSPMYVHENPRINTACRYLNFINNGIVIVLSIVLVVGALLEHKITLLVCLILWAIHIFSRMIVALLITMHLGFFVAVHVIVGFVATFLVFIYCGLILFSYYKKL